jgi:hypothetical protein
MAEESVCRYVQSCGTEQSRIPRETSSMSFTDGVLPHKATRLQVYRQRLFRLQQLET